MTYTQLRDANWKVPYVGGWCLKYVQDAFGTDHPYPTAIGAWNANYGGCNHPGEQPPVGKTVVVYFTLGSVPAGHVAISLDDGSIASSTQAGSHPQGFLHPNLQDLINVYAKYNGGCNYLGWSEYVGTVRVVQPVTQPSKGGDMITNQDQLNKLYDAELHRPRGAGEGEDVYLGKDSGFVFNDLYASPERAKRLAQEAQEKAALIAQRDQATAKSVALVASVSDLTSKLDAATREMVQAESIASDDATKINGLTVQLAAAQAKIDQLIAADKPEPTTPTGTVVPQTTNPPLTPPKTSTWFTNVVDWLVSYFRKNR